MVKGKGLENGTQSLFALVKTPSLYFSSSETMTGISAYGTPMAISSGFISVFFLHPKHPMEMLGLPEIIGTAVMSSHAHWNGAVL